MTAALLNNIELHRRLRGQCRINLLTGNAITLELASVSSGNEACTTCAAPCGNWHANGLAGEFCNVRLVEGASVIEWVCPGCGVNVSEESTVLGHIEAVRAIELDPLCGRCRR